MPAGRAQQRRRPTSQTFPVGSRNSCFRVYTHVEKPRSLESRAPLRTASGKGSKRAWDLAKGGIGEKAREGPVVEELPVQVALGDKDRAEDRVRCVQLTGVPEGTKSRSLISGVGGPRGDRRDGK